LKFSDVDDHPIHNSTNPHNL